MAPRPPVCPDKPLLPGIDVSKFQGKIDWAKVAGARPFSVNGVASRVAFAIARASTGRSVDSRFAFNWREMHKRGIPRGCYLGFHPARTAAVHFATLQKALGDDYTDDDLPPVIDIEKLEDAAPPVGTGPEDVEELVARGRQLVALIEDRMHRRPIIYTGAFWHWQVAAVRPKLAGAFAELPLWTPHYETQCPGVPRGWKRWTIWQHSNSGRVPGIAGAVDLDWFHGTATDLAALISASRCPAAW